MAAALVTLVLVPASQAAPESADAEAVANGLDSLADRLADTNDALGEYQALAESLPLVDLAPGSEQALQLSTLLQDHLQVAAGKLTPPYANMAELAGEIDGLDDTSGDVHVQFGAGALDPTKPAVSFTATSVTIPIHAERTVSQPLDFAFGPTTLAGGGLQLDFELDTTITLQVDPSLIPASPPTAVSIAGTPAIDVCGDATAAVGAFTARFGFTDVKASTDDPSTSGTTEAATLHACTRVAFSDPDSDGRITQDEWTAHALTELAQASVVDGDPGDDLNATFYIDASLVDGDAFTEVEAADASITFADADLSDGSDPTPTPSLGALDDWDNITAGDVADGLSQFVAAFAGSQIAGNGPLPFLKDGLSKTFEAAKPLTDYAQRLTDAEVGCGTTPGDPDSFPTGLIDNLTAGTLVYCRAKTQLGVQSGSVIWTPPPGAPVSATCVPECVNTSGVAADATLGATPSADAVFEMTADGNFDIEVTWDADTGGGTDTRTAVPLPGTAVELFERLAAAAGLDSGLSDKLVYDSSTKALTFRLVKENFDPEEVHTFANFGDLLRNETNLAGLEDPLDVQTPSSFSFTANASDLDFDLTFGVLLLPATTDITPLRGTADGGSSATVLVDNDEDFTDGVNDPRLGNVVKNTSDSTAGNPVQCSIAAIAQHQLTCAPPGASWDAGDGYDIDGGLLDRFFVKVDNDAAEPELAVGDLSVNGALALEGRVGFLEVSASGSDDANTFVPGNGFPADTAFGIAKEDPSKPVVRVDIKTPDPFAVDTNGAAAGGEASIADAIGVGDLLFHLDDEHLDAVCNLKATAGLEVEAAVDGNPAFAKGGVAVDWPSVFEAESCTPDFSSIDVDADADFDLNLRDFDPFPSVTGVHDGGDGDTNLFDSTKNFEANAVSGDNLLNLTLRNKTTGASCVIVTVNPNELECSLSGGSRPGDAANANKWKDGDEYEVEGNALALLSIVIDHLDELVESVDQIAPSSVDKEIPLIGVSTKELVGRIQSLKQTLDDLRGSPLAQVDCTGNVDGTNPATDSLGRPFDLEVLPDNTTIWCRAVSTVEPDAVDWTARELVGTESDLSVLGAFKPDTNGDPDSDPDPADLLDTVGPSPTARVKVVVSDNEGTSNSDTLIDEWRALVEFTDAAGNHTAEFPQASPPSSLQGLEKLIEEKLKVGDPDVFKLDLLDLPDAGDDTPIGSGDHDGSAAQSTLNDDDEDFTDSADDPDVGNLLVNKTDNKHCTITLVAQHALTCEGANMAWDDGDQYEVVGNGTKDLVVRLGFGFCSGGGLCEDEDRAAAPLTVPLNTDLGAVGNLVTLESEGDLGLDFAARAQLDIGVPIKLDLTPDVVVLDTTKAEVAARLNAEDVGLTAAIGPVAVKLGTDVVDTDLTADDIQPGVGEARAGADLKVVKNGGDGIDDNRTFTFGSYFGDLDVDFGGPDPDLECDAPDGDAVEASGDACGVLSVEVAGVPFTDPITLECTADPLTCTPTLPAGLAALVNGEPLSWELLLEVLPQVLAKLEQQLDGAAQDVHIPLVGDTLDAGANVVGIFNDEVVTPFSGLATQLLNAGDEDGDGDTDAWDLARVARQFVVDELGASGADLLLDTNGEGGQAGNGDDVVVTPLCGSPAGVCANGEGVTAGPKISDFRITFEIGQAIDAEVPFDIGLRGLPLRLTGGVRSGGGWSLLVDFGLNRDGPYLVANGKKTVVASDSTKANRPADDDGGTGDPSDDTWDPVKVLQDDDADFNGPDNGNPADDPVEIGMWLQNLGGAGGSGGCRITKVEEHKLFCDDFGTAGTEEGVQWHQTPTTADQYEIRARHAPDTTADPASGAPELALDAEVGMGELPGGAGFTCTDDDHDYSSPGEPSYLAGFSETRCLAGEIAFLAVTVRDKASGDDCTVGDLSDGEDPTVLCLAATLDVTKAGGDRIGLSDLLGDDVGLEPAFTAAANIDVRFRTGLNVGQSAGFPSVLGKFHLYWGFTASASQGPDLGDLEITFDGLNLDLGKFVSQFLRPIARSIQNVTKPLMPVVETLQAEVPIVSDLSKLVGEGPVTMIDLLEAVSGNDLSLLRSVLQFVRFANTIPSDGNLLIGLGSASPGSFKVSGQRAGGSQPTPDKADEGIEDVDGGQNLQNQLASAYPTADDPPDECEGRGSTFGVCGLTFPFLNDASQIFGVLMGKDATLVRYDAGILRAGAGFGYCFPPITIGPVPVQICLGGSFEVRGRFAIGYDTSGLRKVLEGGTGTHLLDGIFIDDLDTAGTDVPEIQFIGTVYAEGAVSIYIFKVGVRGEIIFTTNLDLDDRPDPDGKLRIEEIVSKLNNPICLFVVSGQIDAALSAFVEIDLFFFSKRFSIEIVRITLLKFEVKCEPEPPDLARVEGEVLRLHMGSAAERAKRNVQEDEVNEQFTVRQMESYATGEHAGKTRFSITAFGIQEDEFLTTTAVEDGTAKLVADAGNGDDIITLLPGGQGGTSSTPNSQNPPQPFVLRAEITGGSDADELQTGDGNDDVEGGGENDKIVTGPGVDKIRGGGGDDAIDAGDGDDTDVQGGEGADTISGNRGGDRLQGNGGDDNISAGPDAPTSTASDDLRGGDGNDTLQGDGGDDLLYGDEVLSDCTADGTDTGALEDPDGTGGGDNVDALDGSDGDDELYGGAEEDQLEGGAGDDVLCGGGGRDEINGAAGQDDVEGGGGDDDIVGGTDNSPAPDGGDVLNGGAGRDYMLGDEGTLLRDVATNIVVFTLSGAFEGNDMMNGGGGDDFMWGQGGTDAMNGDGENDVMRGGPADDSMNGNAGDDEMYGEDGVDSMHGNDDEDVMRGGTGADHMDGDGANDDMYGDNDGDDMRGGGGDDLMRGGGGADEMEGNANVTSARPLDDAANPLNPSNFDRVGDGDVLYGDGGQDDVVGGSQGDSPSADGGDTILGNADQDVIAGDNATIAGPAGLGSDLGTGPDGTKNRMVTLDAPGTGGGDDYVLGNEENDDVYAGAGADLVHGNAGDDYVEGNGGADGDGDPDAAPDSGVGLYGDDGQDDLIGGTSQGDGGVEDGGDDIWGGIGHDVIAGDNADVTRAAGSDCPPEPDSSAGFDCNTFRLPDAANVVIRVVQIWDVETTTFAPPAGTSGGDTIAGGQEHDRIYGQGGDDLIEGGAHDDFAFGNAGGDTIRGGDGQDDLVGGTGRTDSSSAASATDGRSDGADTIEGRDDFDALAGDNSRMVRATVDDPNDDTGLWRQNSFNGAVDRTIALMDVATTVDDAPLTNGTSGNDRLLGGDEDDVVYGQGGNDGISGGDDQDVLEGNANGTGDAPNPDPGAYPTWPTFPGDVIHGDDGADDVAGGTGWIWRIVDGVETCDTMAPPAASQPCDPLAGVRVGTDGRKDGGDVVFGDAGGDSLAGDNTVIERALEDGAWILDDLHAPDALDVVRRIVRARDVATVADPAALTNGTSGADAIYGNDGVDVAYGQGGDDQLEGNAHDDHLEGNAGDDTLTGGAGQDDLVGGTGRTFSNDESTAVDGRVDEADAPDGNDTLNGGDGAGGIASGDDDVIVGDNGTADRELGSPIPTADKLPLNGTWQEASWDEPAILRAIRLLDVATTGSTAPETNGTNGGDTINGEADEDLLFGQGGDDAITGDDADLDAPAPADAAPADDYVEGNGGADTIRGDLGEDDLTGGGSAADGVLDSDRNGQLDPTRSGETLRDGGDVVVGDSGDPTVGDGDVVAGDNARIRRPLDALGDWRVDAQRGTQLRDVFLFDLEKVGGQDGLSADPGESGVDTISGNGGADILLGQDNGALADEWGNEATAGDGGAPANCQNAATGPGTGTPFSPVGDDDDDDLPDLNDPQCRDDRPGDQVSGEDGDDYAEGNQGSDTVSGGDGEDDLVGGSSSNDGHVNAILPLADRDASFTKAPENLLDGHDVVEGNAEDDTIAGDNAFVDRYLTPGSGDWITIMGAGHGPEPGTGNPNPHPDSLPWEPTNMVRREVTMKQTPESAGAFGDDYLRGDTEKDDLYGQLGDDWIEGNDGEDAIVGDLGKIVGNNLGTDDPIEDPDPELNEFIAPNQPFLGEFVNRDGVLKREVTLYAFDQSQSDAAVGHDVALGGVGNDWIHTGPGEDLANGNGGDDRLFLGDNAEDRLTEAPITFAHDQVDAGWGGGDHDHLFGGYGADYLDVRPRTTATAPGILPGNDPATWFQVAGTEADQDNFEFIDYIYGGWDQDSLQANVGDNGPAIGDRLLDWSGSYNAYYLCPATYGDWVSTRSIAPGLIDFLQEMAQGDGATTTADAGTSGFRETAIVFPKEVKDNTHPIHPDTPAHFTCGTVEP